MSTKDIHENHEPAPPLGLGSSEELGAWRPIETAPRDRTHMLLLFRPQAAAWGKVAPGMFNPDQYAKRPRPYWEMWLRIGSVTGSREWEPTHWMPMPPPPEAPNVGIERRAPLARPLE